MKVMVVGKGGREHALAWLCNKDEDVKKLYAAPGNAGTAMLEKCENVDIAATNISALADYAKDNKIDLAIIGSEDPLSRGIVNAFRKRGLRIFGPTEEATRIESSKGFADELCLYYGIPTPDFAVFHTPTGAREYVEEHWRDDYKIVVKADGLAAGKGVIVCNKKEEALDAIDKIMVKREFGAAGDRVVLQKKEDGPEMSEIGIAGAGKEGEEGFYMGFATSMDHKPVFDGDKGPNTGGMGAFSPAPIARGHEKALNNVMTRGIYAMYDMGLPYVGALYGGLIITPEGPKKLEFNARFGDPEKQPVAMRMKSRFVPYIIASLEGNLRKMGPPEWDPRPAVCVVVASKGYPGSYETGKLITGLDDIAKMEGVYVFHAGTKEENGNIHTDGGRVLGVTALGEYENDFEGAMEKAYAAIDMIRFDGSTYGIYSRTDIGKKALEYI